MPTPFLLLAPLPHWNGGGVQLAPALAIRQLSSVELACAGTDDAASWWLCHEFENPHPSGSARNHKRRDAATKLLLHAMYAIQVLAPSGGMGNIIVCRCEDSGLIRESAEYRPPFIPTAWARRACVPESFAAEAPVVLERVLEAFHNPVLRLQIPIWLMEQGLIAPDQHIRILLCATGLDSLTKASGQSIFRERLSQLLGADAFIFPPDREARQPQYSVAEVAGHLYQLRNEMAHGLPFASIFHKRLGFLDTSGNAPALEFTHYRYDKVLEECAVFLLCRALREVLLSRLVFDLHRLEWCVAAPVEAQPE